MGDYCILVFRRRLIRIAVFRDFVSAGPSEPMRQGVTADFARGSAQKEPIESGTTLRETHHDEKAGGYHALNDRPVIQITL